MKVTDDFDVRLATAVPRLSGTYLQRNTSGDLDPFAGFRFTGHQGPDEHVFCLAEALQRVELHAVHPYLSGHRSIARLDSDVDPSCPERHLDEAAHDGPRLEA